VVELTVFAPADQITHHAPRGFIFTDEVFNSAGMQDSISADQSTIQDLRRTLSYLDRRYPGRLKIDFVDFWTFKGLVTAFRYRIRTYPAIIIDGSLVLSGEQLEFKSLEAHISALLSNTRGS
jgi:hypothetical protein